MRYIAIAVKVLYNHVLLMDEMQWLIWSSVRSAAEFGNGLTDGQALAQCPICTHIQGRLYLYNYTRVRRWTELLGNVFAEGGKELWIYVVNLFKHSKN